MNDGGEYGLDQNGGFQGVDEESTLGAGAHLLSPKESTSQPRTARGYSGPFPPNGGKYNNGSGSIVGAFNIPENDGG